MTPGPGPAAGYRLASPESTKPFLPADGAGERTFRSRRPAQPSAGWPCPRPLSFGRPVRPVGERGRATRKLYFRARFAASNCRLTYCVSRFISASDLCNLPRRRAIDHGRSPPRAGVAPLPRCAGPTQQWATTASPCISLCACFQRGLMGASLFRLPAARVALATRLLLSPSHHWQLALSRSLRGPWPWLGPAR